MTDLNSLRVLLLQAREAEDIILTHELDCFVERAGLTHESFHAINLVTDAVDARELKRADVVMIGGSGAFSVVKGGFDWHEPMLELMREVVAQGKPMFASCFGFQALVQAMGGQVVSDKAQAEVGTFLVTRTAESEADELFATMSPQFDVQLGHNDSALTLPEGFINMARSERCAHQAVRVAGLPIVATQFHPELTNDDNITRYMRYLEAYRPAEMTMEEARQHAEAIHRPSHESNRLVRRFLEQVFA